MKAPSPRCLASYRHGSLSSAERRSFCCALIASALAAPLMTGCTETAVAGPTLTAARPLEIYAEGSGMATSVELDGGSVVRGENALWVRLSDPEATLTGVNAVMPAHGHDTAPATIELTDGDYRVAGLLLFMPGRWEVTLELQIGSMRDRAVFSVDVP